MTDPLRLMVLTRDRTDRIQRAADCMLDFLNARPDVEVVSSVVVEELEPSRLDRTDLIVVLGGDGAILRACRKLGLKQRPILGVNLGRLGFLADVSPREFRERFEELVQRRFEVVDHMMFQVTLERADGSGESFLGLNEAAVSAASPLQIIDVALSIDGQPVTTYSCDGLIVSTPVGSTAHSLSAGGPAIRPDLEVFVITPISPHTLSNRSIVDDAKRTYRLSQPGSRTDVVLVVDGQIRRPLGAEDTIRICRADVSFQLARLAGHNYYAVLQNKLGWSGQPRYATQDPADE